MARGTGPAWRFQTVGDVDVSDKGTLDPVRPNAGLTARYRRKLEALLDEMQRSLVYWISAKYRANEPEIAQDASPAMEMRRTVRKLARRWEAQFNQAAPELADYFAQAVQDRTDAQLRDILRRGGFSVRFKATAAQNDVFQATVGENVGLIRSIAQEHLKNVETQVMRSVAQGRKLSELSRELSAAYGVSRRRAALIARDQNNKATATMQRVRQQELGITQAIWVHSAGGKTPRPSHVAMNGKPYDVAKGMWDPDEKKWIRPGELVNCRCVSRSIIPGFD